MPSITHFLRLSALSFLAIGQLLREKTRRDNRKKSIIDACFEDWRLLILINTLKS
ncbi:hypothetical protein GCM10009114_15880 [Aliiglaciecola litoralis]|uniref:Transposase n=1 Tax=Aliiglaciecola litoralis TaxID=582857 RepID=A0ABP3WVI6_9ALTE